MMTARTLNPRDVVYSVIEDLLGIATPDADLSKPFADLGADSLDVLEITMAVEGDLEIPLADQDIGIETTVGEFIGLVERLHDELTSAEIGRPTNQPQAGAV